MKYILKMTETQMRIIMEALDLFSRLGIGQVEEVNNMLSRNLKTEVSFNDRKLLSEYKMKVFGYPENVSYGICNEEVSKVFKDAYDMIKTIQLRLALDGFSHKWSVWWDGNLLKLGDEPVIEIEKKE